ncbi:DUF3102 domain-containing protein [Mesorhizobium sophorae]|uniref:DUF3102 domain-containing protein n=1 Tax=Mesorhizobium sophorae TaxID=1300294 RepID=UPI000BA31AC6|nr:DUF3102 domain-containing protein [Mesorhizobium sophorae]
MASSVAKVTTMDRGAAVVGFSYDAVPVEHREAVREDARQIRMRLIETAEAMMDIGERLHRSRGALPHGTWLPWLISETGMSEQWSRDCMNLYLRFHDQPTLIEDLDIALSPTAIVRLASAPEAAYEDIMSRVQEGEKLRVVDVEETIKEHRDRERGMKGKGPRARAFAEDAAPVGADALQLLFDRARDELIPQVIARAQAVLCVLEDAEEAMSSGKRVTAKELQNLRSNAQWLTDALEQLSQRRAGGQAKVVHQTFLDRPPLDAGPWSDAAAFLRDISSSDAIVAALKAGVPAFVERGAKALRLALFR